MTDYAVLFENHMQLMEVFLMAAKKKDNNNEMKNIIKGINDSPIFQRIAAASDYERIGLLLHREGNVEGEFTNCIHNGKLVSVEEGLKDVEFTIKIDLNMWDQISTPEESEWMKDHPLEAVRKYWKHIEMPFMVKMKLGAKLLTS